MLIFGSGTKTLGSKKLQLENCPNCDANNLHITCVVKYFHIFWIPTFPLERMAYPKCQNCGQEPRITNQKTIDKIRQEKKSFQYPLYLYSGFGAIALLIAFVFYIFYEHDQRVTENIQNVKSMDVIVFESSAGEYSFGRVTEVRNDTVFMNLSNYYFDKTPSESDYLKEKADALDFYDDELFYFTQETLIEMHATDDIYDLYRKEE